MVRARGLPCQITGSGLSAVCHLRVHLTDQSVSGMQVNYSGYGRLTSLSNAYGALTQ